VPFKKISQPLLSPSSSDCWGHAWFSGGLQAVSLLASARISVPKVPFSSEQPAWKYVARIFQSD